MENFSLLVMHTWRRRLLCKRRNMWVQSINIERLEFGIFSPFPVQYLPNAGYVICMFTMRGIVDCLVVPD